MTALQDWLTMSPVTPRNIKAAIRTALRGVTHEDTGRIKKPQLMGRGLERC
ncbi:MAG: hypothetical protein AB7G47_19235 [Mycolicibacterium sp.]|uniref:hypothetical protein n=1 Tax=Mycolicibacterium sp. TaxID=2320850 RepID=UPI003D0DE876